MAEQFLGLARVKSISSLDNGYQLEIRTNQNTRKETVAPPDDMAA